MTNNNLFTTAAALLNDEQPILMSSPDGFLNFQSAEITSYLQMAKQDLPNIMNFDVEEKISFANWTDELSLHKFIHQSLSYLKCSSKAIRIPVTSSLPARKAHLSTNSKLRRD